MTYLYETHLHTSGISKCATSYGDEYIEGYLEKGYTGIIITDHFFNANCALSRKLPWRDWVDCFYRGYEIAKEEGDKKGLDVFFGWEETFDGCDDYLIYGLDKKWLMEHPEVRTWTRGEQYRAVREAGGCVVQAHPFRQRSYIQRVVLSAGCVDAVEVFNGGNDIPAFDALAYHYAKKLGKPMTSGTDIHDDSIIRHGKIYGVYSGKKLNNISDFVSMILNNEVAGLKGDKERIDFFNEQDVTLPVEIRNENDIVIGKDWKEYVY